MPQSDDPAGNRRRLPRNVWVAGLASLFTDISSEMIVPVLPLFLTGVLAASPASIGLIEGVAEATASLLKVVSGWWSDRVRRRKPFMLFGYGLSNLIKPLFALAQSWPQVLVIRFADRFGKGVRGAPRDALIADSVDASQRGRAFGVHRMMDTLGAAIGPLVSFAILMAFQDDYRRVFWWSALPGVVSVVVLSLWLRDSRRGTGRHDDGATGHDGLRTARTPQRPGRRGPWGRPSPGWRWWPPSLPWATPPTPSSSCGRAIWGCPWPWCPWPISPSTPSTR